jgi:hypothetical protein
MPVFMTSDGYRQSKHKRNIYSWYVWTKKPVRLPNSRNPGFLKVLDYEAQKENDDVYSLYHHPKGGL